jgi:prephenate dehydrogenase
MADKRPKPRITIIGTGLIGASIGLRLTQRPDRNYEVVGIDRDRNNAKRAKHLNAIDREITSLEEALHQAGIVILAVPVAAARRLLEDIGPFLSEGAIVTDTCSTKAAVMVWAQEFLPEGVSFIGGHPIAGKERSGPDAAEATLFEGVQWALAPAPNAHEGAVAVMLGLIEQLGANAVYIDPEEHDQYLAAVSHVPLLLSVGLFRMVRDSTAWEDLALLAGPGFRDMTRLASGDPEMGRDIVGTNREAILHWLRRLQEELTTIEEATLRGADVITDLLTSTQLDRDTFLLNPPVRRTPDGPALPSSRDALGRLLAGGLYDKLKDAEDRIPQIGAERRQRKQLEEAEKRKDER